MPPPGAVFTVDMERIEKIERQLAALWKQVQDGGEKQDQRHVDILVLYNTLKDQLHTQTDRESLGLWVSSLLEQRLGVLHAELEKESSARSKVRQRSDLMVLVKLNNSSDFLHQICFSTSAFISCLSLFTSEHLRAETATGGSGSTAG